MRISSLKAFHEHVGEVIMYCQRIEHDLKLIYAALKTDSVYAGRKQSSSTSRTDVFREYYKKIESKSMGDILSKLEKLDTLSGGNPYFHDYEYDSFDELKSIRNHWAHEGYLQFLYSGKDYEENFRKQAEKLKTDLEKVRGLCESVEDVRLDTLQIYEII